MSNDSCLVFVEPPVNSHLTTILCGPPPKMSGRPCHKTVDGLRFTPPIEVWPSEIKLSGKEAALIANLSPGNITRRMHADPELGADEGLTLPKLRRHFERHPVCHEAKRKPADRTRPVTEFEYAEDADELTSRIHDIVSLFLVSKPASRDEICGARSEDYPLYA